MFKPTQFAQKRALAAGLACCAIAGALASNGAAMAQTPQGRAAFAADYAISLAGVSIGAAKLTLKVDNGGAYALDMHARLTGLAGVLVSGKGGARATGVINGESLTPATLAVVASTASEKRTLRMSFAGGAVNAIEIKPPLEDWEHPDRVPVVASHRQSVIDPLSALLMPAPGKSLADACNRTIPVFDGATRFDIVLRYKGTTTLSQGGYNGPAATCTARYTPVSGHRPQRSMTQFMTDNSDMGVVLVPVGSSGLFAPWRIYVRTTLGMSLLQATRVRIDGLQTAHSVRKAGTGDGR